MNDYNWVEDLARSEREKEHTGIVEHNGHLNREQMLRKGAEEMLMKIHRRILHYSEMFNTLRGSSSNSIKVYKITNTPADFMMFRNSLKVIFSNRDSGDIYITFSPYSGGLYSKKSTEDVDKLEAHLGPFNNVYWTFMGHKVDADEIIRHYFTEFISGSQS